MQQFIETTEEGIEEIRIGHRSGIQTPVYLPEIKSVEDLETILYNRETLQDNNPVLVPGHSWQNIRTNSRLTGMQYEVAQLLKNHPPIYYEPPGLFRYKMPQRLVTHAFRKNRGQAGDFYDELRDGELERAMQMLPTFFRPFLEPQLNRLLESKGIEAVPDELVGEDGRITDAWRDSRADRGYKTYYHTIIDDALRWNAYVTPPVPPILAASGSETIKRMIGSNRLMAGFCEAASEKYDDDRRTYSYFHTYIDSQVVSPSTEIDRDLLTAIESDLKSTTYAGVVLTISNYDRAWGNNLSDRLEQFVNDIVNIARENYLPVILPRSSWYGAYLTDQGVHAFGSLLNGADRYRQKVGGGLPEEASYGKVPIYGDAVELSAGSVDEYLQSHGELTKVDGLPSKPRKYTPGARSLKDKFGDDREFRITFGKARRLAHAEEAREFREGRKKGTMNPAERYFERSEHPHLS